MRLHIPRPTKLLSRLSTPARWIVAVLLVVGVFEFTVMAALGALSDALPWWALTLIDTALLTALVSLFIWFELVTPLRRALDREQLKARNVLDNASEGIITIDPHGMIRGFNRAAEHMFGYSAAEAIGSNVSLIVPDPHKGHHDVYLQRYAELGHSQVMNTRRQVTAQRRDRSVFPVEMSLSEVVVRDERLITAILLDITERRRLEQRVHRLAHYDELTGLPNRALYLDELERALAFAHRQQHRVGLLFLDLDSFKPINDRHGHSAGDELLRQVAARLSAQVRESDIVARLGGDEFTVILPAIQDRAAAEDAALRIAQAFDQPFEIAAHAASIGISVGIAMYPDDAMNARDLTQIADTRMYGSKGERKSAWLDTMAASAHANR
jgi:diguanylate cyclase (GGDEF)-like protein/PAS domain S-box-containing protein